MTLTRRFKYKRVEFENYFTAPLLKVSPVSPSPTILSCNIIYILINRCIHESACAQQINYLTISFNNDSASINFVKVHCNLLCIIRIHEKSKYVCINLTYSK